MNSTPCISRVGFYQVFYRIEYIPLCEVEDSVAILRGKGTPHAHIASIDFRSPAIVSSRQGGGALPFGASWKYGSCDTSPCAKIV